MRVSVTLHRQQPGEDGNQREYEAQYQNFNRQYAEMVIDPDTGTATCQFEGLKFPAVGDDSREVLQFFSIGCCQAPADAGGAVIISGPLLVPIVADKDVVPVLSAACAIPAERIAAMVDDGRLFLA